MGRYSGEVEERTFSTKPPIPEERLVNLYKRWRGKNRSSHIPQNYTDAAAWWISHQEPQTQSETPVSATDSKGNSFWSAPYADRLHSTFQIFLALSEPEKAFVIQKIESGTPWRGDSIEIFKMICEETDKMNLNKQAYIASASESLARMRARA